MIHLFYSLLLLAGWGGATAAGAPVSMSQSAFVPSIILDSIHNASCANSADGAVFITVKQENLPLLYEWSNGDTTPNLLNVPAGVYACTVTDANGDQGFLEDVTISAPPALVLSIESATAPDCLGHPGQISLITAGGVAPYTYLWNDNSVDPQRSDLDEGNYSATVTDANGCTESVSVALFTDFPQAVVNDAVITCAHPTATLSGEESSTGPEFIYAWSTPDGFIIGNSDSLLAVAGSSGVYDLQVTNTLNGCVAEAEAVVSVDSVPPFADAGDDFTLPCTNTVDTLHGAGSAGVQFSYHWSASNGGHLASSADSLKVVFDHTGVFVLSVFDAHNGCSANDTVVVTGLNEPPSAFAFGDTLTCVQDSALLTSAFDTVNTQFIWQGPNGFTSLLPNPKVGDPGSFVLTVTDTLTGCFSAATALVVLDTVKPVIEFSFAGTITCIDANTQIGVNVDTSIVTVFHWTGPLGFDSFEQNPLVGQPGQYILQATNFANGCSINDTVSVAADLNPPIADAGPDQSLDCLASQLALDGSGSTQGDSIVYVWTTLDGNILGGDSTQTPLVNAAGTYTLVVANSINGCTATDEAVVDSEITPITATAVAYDTLSCVVSEVQIFASTNPVDDVTYAWTGPNGFTSTDLNPVASDFGTYTLTATYVPSGCTATATAFVATTAAVADAGPQKALTCVVSSVLLDGTASSAGTYFSYLWTTVDGNIVSGENTLTPVVDAVGTYILTVADTVNNCSSTAETTVVWDTLPPVASAGADQSLTCSSLTATLDASGSSGAGALQFAWNTNNGNFVSGAGTATPVVDKAGEYHVVVTDLSNGCSASDMVTVGINQTLPVAGATASGMLTCVNTTVQLNGTSSLPGSSFHWSGPNGFTSDQQNTTTILPGTYQLTVQNIANGCTGTANVTVVQNVMPPTLTASAGVLTCAHPTVTIMTSALPASTTFSWVGPNGFTSTEQNPTVGFTGLYNLTATNPANGCTNSVSALVLQNITPPNVSASGGTLSCTQTTLVLNATATPAGAAFAWTGPNGFTSGVANPTVSQSGTYTVTATSAGNGCTASTTVTVDNNTQAPTAYAGQDLPLSCINGLLTLNGIGSSSGSQYTYHWTTVDGHIIIGQNTLAPRVDSAGVYVLVVTNTSNGCTASDEAVITNPLDVTAVISGTQPVSCNGGGNGSATVLAGGGDEVYAYSWSNGATTATASNLSAGVYAVTVYDQVSACSAIASATVTEPALLTANTTVTAETFPDADDGTATVTALGGTAPYTYVWSNGQTTPAIANLAPGTYFVTATDAHGCTATSVANINPSTCALAATANTNPVKCFGENNGSATAAVTGSVGPPAFVWSNGATTASVQNLAPGNYSFTVTDLAGCHVVVPFQITTPQALGLTLIAQQNVLCVNDVTGSLSVASSGGTGPYSYSWSNGGSTPVQSGLGAGAYSLTATDAKGCSKTFSATITTTDNIPPLVITENASVALNANGTATVPTDIIDNGSADGECGISSLSLSPNSFNCDQLGTHIVYLTATDVNGNTASASATVTVVDNIAPTLSCPANIAAGACQPDVQFALPQVVDNCPFNPAQLILASGLPSGSAFPEGVTTQTFSYTDAAGNNGTCSFQVTVSPALAVSVQSVPASCGQTCDGTATLNITGGAQPYSILWSNGSTSPTIGNLCIDTYTATVTDAQGCSQVLTADVPSADHEAPVLVLHNASIGLDGSGIAAITPATFDAGSTDNCGDLNWMISDTEFNCDQLGEHIVTLTATDNSGNSAQQTVIATIEDNIAPTLFCPDDIAVSLCAATVSFLQPIVMDNCSTGQPQLTSGLPSGSLFPLGATTQVFTAVDPSGNTGTCSFTVTVQESFSVTSTVIHSSCAGACNGSISLSVTGAGTAFSVQWSNGAAGINLHNLCAGPYGATVTDVAGCTKSFSFTINEPPALSISVDAVEHDLGNTGVGSIDVTVGGGTAPYVFAWTRDGQPFASTEDLSGLSAGTYQLIMTDANGCTFAGPSVVVTNVSSASAPVEALRFVLAPNPALDQVELRFGEPIAESIMLYLFDAMGQLVHSEQIEAGTQVFKLDIHTLPAGIWQVHLLDAEGRRTTKQLVKMQ